MTISMSIPWCPSSSTSHVSNRSRGIGSLYCIQKLEENFFSPIGGQLGPFHLYLSNIEGRLIFDVRDANDADLLSVRVPAKSFRRIIRDYFMVCETYFEAIKTKTPSQIETIDMGRRGLHNEGAEVLKERLAEHVEVDHHTARRLFTLICVLHIKG